MSPIRFTNLTQFSDPREITIIIEASEVLSRIGRHVIKPNDVFTVNPMESGVIEGWIKGQLVPFQHDKTSACVGAEGGIIRSQNVFQKRGRLVVQPETNLRGRGFDPGYKKEGTISGLNVRFIPGKERK